MRKAAFILILAFSILTLDAATGDSAGFYVRAYKVGEQDVPFLDLGVYGALEDTLISITPGEEIDLTSYTNGLKSNEIGNSESLEPYDEHVVFSLRVTGNYVGSFRCTTTINPFTLSSDSSKKLTAYYEMRDVSCVFLTDYKAIGEKGGVATKTSVPSSGVSVSDNSQSFVIEWNISNSTQDALENWRMQASCGLAISKTDYEGASKGVYKANIQIKLEVV